MRSKRLATAALEHTSVWSMGTEMQASKHSFEGTIQIWKYGDHGIMKNKQRKIESATCPEARAMRTRMSGFKAQGFKSALHRRRRKEG